MTHQPRIIIMGTYIHTDILIHHTRYYVTNYFRLKATAKKTVENGAAFCLPYQLVGFLFTIFAILVMIYESDISIKLLEYQRK